MLATHRTCHRTNLPAVDLSNLKWRKSKIWFSWFTSKKASFTLYNKLYNKKFIPVFTLKGTMSFKTINAGAHSLALWLWVNLPEPQFNMYNTNLSMGQLWWLNNVYEIPNRASQEMLIYFPLCVLLISLVDIDDNLHNCFNIILY